MRNERLWRSIPFCTTFLASIYTRLGKQTHRRGQTHRSSNVARILLLLILLLMVLRMVVLRLLVVVLVGRNTLGGYGQTIGALELDFQSSCDS
jgi:hypothetical protein